MGDDRQIGDRGGAFFGTSRQAAHGIGRSDGRLARGRQLSDDVIDAELSLITNGKLTGDCVANESTFSSTFPYLGSPN